MVGCFTPSKHGQLKNLEEAIHIFKTYVAEPLALSFDWGWNILLLVLIVCLFNFVHGNIGPIICNEALHMVEKEAVKKFTN